MVSKSFDIHTNQLQPFDQQTRRLLLELSADALSVILWDKKNSRPAAIEVFNGHINNIEDWQVLLNQSRLLSYKELETLVLLGLPHAISIPAFLYNPTIAVKQLELLFGEAADVFTSGDVLPENEMVFAWQLPKGIHDMLKNHFSILLVKHVASVLISSHKKVDYLQGNIIIYGGLAWVLLWQNEELQFVNSVPAAHPDDLSYHLLNICHQYKFVPADVHWEISGMVEEGSPLLNAITRFFEKAVLRSDFCNLDELPEHYFAHLQDVL